MKFTDTKKKLGLLIVFLGLFHLVEAQLPADDPTTRAEWIADNSVLAHAFAPVYFQFFNNTYGDEGRHDMPLRVNYDNDWNQENNWDHDHLIDVPTMHPAAYYHVFWTDTYWIICYSFYHPRDYANNNIGCKNSNHEGDLERVFVFVDRPTSEVYDVEDLLRGMTTNNHGYYDYVNCIGASQMEVIDNSETLASGAHPWIYLSAGSHAIFQSYNRAKDDVTGTSWCAPRATDGNTFTLRPVPPGGATRSSGDIMDSYGYRLIDLYDVTDGLWSKRNYSSVFIPETIFNREDQKFNGDNPNENSDKASAPWREVGFDPNSFIGTTFVTGIFPFFQFYSFGAPFDCNCKPASDPCTPTTFVADDYTYNGLKCKDIQMGTPYVNTSNQLVFTLETSSAFDPDVDGVYWSISAPINFSCDGCMEGERTIVLTPNNGAPCVPISVSVHAALDATECELSHVHTYYSNYTPCESGHFVEVNTHGCFATLEYQNHQSSNTYAWSFAPNVNYFSWGPYAEVFAEPSEFGQIFGYSLVVNNGTPLTGFFSLDCDDDYVLLASPNPSNDNVLLKMENFTPTTLQEGVEIIITDQYSNIKATQTTDQGEVNLDVSKFQEGLYYVMVRDKNGKTTTTNFVVSRSD